MGSFGERMRRERETCGITLDSISRTTKIGIHILEALEKEEFDRLPGGIFNKGFVRSYARFLGMNEEEVLKEFLEVAGDPEQPLPDPPVPRRPEMRRPKVRRSWGSVATVVVCAIALLYGGWKTARMLPRAAWVTWSGVHRARVQPAMTPDESVATNNPSSRSSHGNRARVQPAMTPDESVATNNPSSRSSHGNRQPASVPATDQPKNAATTRLQLASQTTTTPAPELVPAAATTGGERLVIVVTANKPAWVSITADGEPVLDGVLKRKKKIHAYSQVVLKTNNAGALAVSHNGKPPLPLGDQDQPTTVTFTPDGVTQTSTVSSETGEVDSEGPPHVSDGLDRQEPTRDDPQRPQSPGSSDTPPNT
jgi:cytoskeleton protein RodZ